MLVVSPRMVVEERSLPACPKSFALSLTNDRISHFKLGPELVLPRLVAQIHRVISDAQITTTTWPGLLLISARCKYPFTHSPFSCVTLQDGQKLHHESQKFICSTVARLIDNYSLGPLSIWYRYCITTKHGNSIVDSVEGSSESKISFDNCPIIKYQNCQDLAPNENGSIYAILEAFFLFLPCNFQDVQLASPVPDSSQMRVGCRSMWCNRGQIVRNKCIEYAILNVEKRWKGWVRPRK
jgi:hypothetical protein